MLSAIEGINRGGEEKSKFALNPLLSGLLVTELVYYYINLSFVLPVAVGVMFTLLHALIQTYVLTMLTALFYGEVTEPSKKKIKK